MSSESNESAADTTSTPATSVVADELEQPDEKPPVGVDIENESNADKSDISATSREQANDEDVPKVEQVRRLLGGAVAIATEDDAEQLSSLKGNLSDEITYTYLKKPLEERKSDSSKKNLQALSYLLLMEDRIKELESQVKDLQTASLDVKRTGNDAKEDKDVEKPVVLEESRASKQSKLLLSPRSMGWKEFVNPTREQRDLPRHVIDVLNEHPFPLVAKGSKARRNGVPHHNGSEDNRKATENESVERVRINSDALNELIATTIGIEPLQYTDITHIRPFKFLLACEDSLVARLTELKAKAGLSAETRSDEDSEKSQLNADSNPNVSGPAEASEQGTLAPTQEDTTAGDNTESDGTAAPIEGEQAREDLERKHLECLLEFLETSLKWDLQACRQLRAREQTGVDPSIDFRHLWHLYRPGDVVFDPVVRQAYQVLFVTGGRKMLTRVAADSMADDDDDKEAEVERVLVVDEEATTSVVLTCFHLDFNGKSYGPVQREFKISPFDIPRPIRSLPVFPIEYAAEESQRPRKSVADALVDDAAAALSDDQGTHTCLETMTERGQKFAKLTSCREVAHKEYAGFSLDEVREQVDSQIIIDLALFYEKFPSRIPSLGITEPDEGSLKEVQESYYLPCNCSDTGCNYSNYADGLVFDDRIVDKALMSRFKAQNPGLFGASGAGKDKLDRDCHYLLPRKIHGFVLRSRSWSALDVEKISDFQARTESFGQLVLPEQHKHIVEGLVKTHSKGRKPVKGAEGDGIEARQDDLVRGKGEGLIILLHGVPGVGKTSTAECVAEYTGRPLFALTCGDIGDTAKDVQDNLTENFQLAHRWGCVMLLDEADVFLQQRDKSNMQRNAVVSVFLRILEYYSGILFLTTNKVGTFDEAFKSRIHISLYYQQLDKDRSKQIWDVNFQRLKDTRPHLEFDRRELRRWVKKVWKDNEAQGLRPWNGRQIHNACQTAAALAEFQSRNKLSSEHLEAVAQTSREFDEYLKSTHGGDDFDRAKSVMDRGDDKYQATFGSPERRSGSKRKVDQTPSKSGGKKASKKREPSSDEDSSDDSEKEEQEEQEESESSSEEEEEEELVEEKTKTKTTKKYKGKKDKEETKGKGKKDSKDVKSKVKKSKKEANEDESGKSDS